MGLDLKAFKKNKSFNQKELDIILNNEQKIDALWLEHSNFVNQLCLQTNKKSFDDFCNENSKKAIDTFLELPLIREDMKSKGLLTVPDGETISPVLNYYFKNCLVFDWNEIPDHQLDLSLLRLESYRPWIPFGAQFSGDDKTSLTDLIDVHSLMNPENIPLAIERIKNRQCLDKKDLRMLLFLEKYSQCSLAFI